MSKINFFRVWFLWLNLKQRRHNLSFWEGMHNIIIVYFQWICFAFWITIKRIIIYSDLIFYLLSNKYRKKSISFLKVLIVIWILIFDVFSYEQNQPRLLKNLPIDSQSIFISKYFLSTFVLKLYAHQFKFSRNS